MSLNDMLLSVNNASLKSGKFLHPAKVVSLDMIICECYAIIWKESLLNFPC